MANAELISKIKAEFERRIKILREDKVVRQNCTSNFLEGKIFGYEQVLSFLSTLKSEKPIGLEEEINKFRTIFKNECDPRIIGEVANHFAQWGAENFKK